MNYFRQIGRIAALSGLFLTISACTTSVLNVEPEPAGEPSAVSSFPYDPLVYHLDLSILAYQIYGQSLVWPFDPYYEEMEGRRDQMMKTVHVWAKQKGREQAAAGGGLDSYRGPGALGGFTDNPAHDPILYNYSRIDPWNNSLTNANGKWTEYLTPRAITAKIRDAYVCYRPAGGSASSVAIEKISRRQKRSAPGASDTLLAFEGGTGDKGEAGRPASQSLMGFVLIREKPGGDFDLHIAFRGSRSGSAGRAVLEAFSDGSASGNPDWITDLGYNRLSSGQGGAVISTIGRVHRGFAQSMRSILPRLMHCLGKAADLKSGASPTNIYVTGHSLGGALAQNFVSALLQGNRYGPNATGSALPARLRGWPWTRVKLVTYGAPRVGDETFARALTATALQSEFFSTEINPIDTKAIKPDDPTILPRLLDPLRPAGFRVLNSKDPVTTEKVAGGKHVGKTVYVNKPNVRDLLPPPDFSAHEQRQIRDFIVKKLRRSGIPKLAMRYLPMKDVNPGRDAGKKGSPAEMRKLAVAMKKYYAANGIWLDQTGFDRDLELRLAIENGN